MKKITGFKIDISEMPTSATSKPYSIYGENGAIFSLQIGDSTGKFYNFKTKTFTSAFVSENTLSNISIFGAYNGIINFPAAASGDTYTIYLFTDPHFETELSNSLSPQNKILLTTKITQVAAAYIRFGLATDQSSSKFSGTYNAGSSITYATVTRSPIGSTKVNLTYSLPVTDPASPSFGYKCIGPNIGVNKGNDTPIIDPDLLPIDGDFYTVTADQTNGSGSSSSSMILDSVSGLVIGMNLVDITSSSVTTSGSLGVLTYPTITSISGNTITLSSTHTWADNKAVTFRAYGSRLIKESNGIDVEFLDTACVCKTPETFSKNADVSGTSIAIDGVTSGLSAGAYLIGSNITTSSNANLLTAVHATGTPLTTTGAQTLKDGQVLSLSGVTDKITVTGSLKISSFPTSDTVIYLDIDKVFVLGTTS